MMREDKVDLILQVSSLDLDRYCIECCRFMIVLQDELSLDLYFAAERLFLQFVSVGFSFAREANRNRAVKAAAPLAIFSVTRHFSKRTYLLQGHPRLRTALTFTYLPAG